MRLPRLLSGGKLPQLALRARPGRARGSQGGRRGRRPHRRAAGITGGPPASKLRILGRGQPTGRTPPRRPHPPGRAEDGPRPARLLAAGGRGGHRRAARHGQKPAASRTSGARRRDWRSLPDRFTALERIARIDGTLSRACPSGSVPRLPRDHVELSRSARDPDLHLLRDAVQIGHVGSTDRRRACGTPQRKRPRGGDSRSCGRRHLDDLHWRRGDLGRQGERAILRFASFVARLDQY